MNIWAIAGIKLNKSKRYNSALCLCFHFSSFIWRIRKPNKEKEARPTSPVSRGQNQEKIQRGGNPPRQSRLRVHQEAHRRPTIWAGRFVNRHWPVTVTLPAPQSEMSQPDGGGPMGKEQPWRGPAWFSSPGLATGTSGLPPAPPPLLLVKQGSSAQSGGFSALERCLETWRCFQTCRRQGPVHSSSPSPRLADLPSVPQTARFIPLCGRAPVPSPVHGCTFSPFRALSFVTS